MNEFGLLINFFVISLTILGLGFAGFLAYLFMSRVLPVLRVTDDRKKQLLTWRTFAEEHRLSYVSGSFLGPGTHVVGGYRGHSLTLDTVAKNWNIYTRITLFINYKVSSSLAQKKELDQESLLGETARLLASGTLPETLKGQITAETNNQTLVYEQAGVETDLHYLKFLFDLLCDLAEAYPNSTAVAVGGEIMPLLQTIVGQETHPLREMAIELLQSIGQETTTRLRLQAPTLLCSRCIVRCDEHQVPLSALSAISYYGCRACGQSRQFFLFEGRIIAVLDSRMGAQQAQENGILRVSWLKQQALFDFDEVEIGQVTDEVVERFAMQVGNDTDPARRSRYQQMCCSLSPAAKLSENSLRVLRRTFGQVIEKV